MATRKARTTADTDKAKTARKVRKEQNEKDIAQISADKIAQSIAKVSVETAKSLASINEVVQGELTKLATVTEAVEFKEEELVSIHGKEAVLKSLDELKVDFDNQKNELETDIENTRSAWDKEQVEHESSVRERDIALTKKRQQEEADYEYQVKNARRENENQWQETVYQRQQQEKRRQQDLTAQWEEREKSISEREADVAKKEDLINSFDERVKSEVGAQVAKAKNAIVAEYKSQTQLSEAETSKKTALLEQKVKSLEAEVEAHKVRVASLEDEISSARSEMNEMAKEALRAKSGQDALAAVQSMTQQNSGKSR